MCIRDRDGSPARGGRRTGRARGRARSRVRQVLPCPGDARALATWERAWPRGGPRVRRGDGRPSHGPRERPRRARRGRRAPGRLDSDAPGGARRAQTGGRAVTPGLPPGAAVLLVEDDLATRRVAIRVSRRVLPSG